jgi:DNA-binding SARP family transcriptional activator
MSLATVQENDLRITLLGGFGLSVGGRQWEIPPAAARLVAFLALQPGPVVRSHVAGVLWGDRSDERAGACLRSAIWRVNAGHGAPVVVANRSRVALQDGEVDARVATVVAHSQLAGGSPVSPELLSGELLPGWYDDWVIVERERLRQLCLEGMEEMAQNLLSAGLWRRAIEAALAVVAAEPLRESAHRVLIDAHVGAGNRGEALRQFRLCRALLARELGLTPGPELVAAVGRAYED